ncbi:MAG: DUF4397 domain-containing protein [Polyangiales bacterium]
MLLPACGAAPPRAPRPLPTEVLNAAAQGPLEDDSFGAPRRAAEPVAPPVEAPPPATASVRVIHASPDRAAASVDVYVGGNGTPGASALAFRHAAGPLSVPTGAQPLAVRAAGAAAAAPLLSGDSPSSGLAHLHRRRLRARGQRPDAPRARRRGDDETAPEASSARVRLFHAVAGLSAVDVCTPAAPARAGSPARPAAAIFANAAYGAFTDYVAVPAGAAVTLQLRARNARPCAGLLRGTVSLTPAEGVATLVATGRVAPGANNVPRVLLVCPQGGEGASCTEAPVR